MHPALATFLLSMLPLAELRVAIPLAMANFDLATWQIFIVAVVGSFIPAVLILYFLEPISQWLSQWKVWDKFFKWLFYNTRKRFDQKYALWGRLALMMFVAIPLPGTGVWTGSLAAWLFNLGKKQSLIYIALGAILSGGIVTLITLGVLTIFKFYL